MSKESEVLSNFSLDDFSWDNEASVDEKTVSTVKEVSEEEESSEESDDSEQQTEAPKKVTVVTGIDEKGKTEEKTEIDSKQEGGKTKENDTSTGTGSGNEDLFRLREQGFIDFEDTELEEQDFDREYFLETKREEAISNKLESLLANIPQGLKDMIRYSAQGGDFMEVVRDLAAPTELSKDMDVNSEEDQKRIITATLKQEGKSISEIQEYLEFLEFKGKLAAEASARYDRFLTEEETREARRIEKHKQEIAKRNAQIAKDKKDAQEFFSKTTESFNGVRYTKTEKRDLPDFVYSPTVELEDGRVTTPFNYQLLQALQDKEKTMFLAKIIKADFKLDSFARDIENKVINTVEDNLQGRSSGTKGSSQSQQPKTHLVDFL